MKYTRLCGDRTDDRTSINAILPTWNGITATLQACIHRQAPPKPHRSKGYHGEVPRLRAREITFTSGGREATIRAIISAAALGKRKHKAHCFTVFKSRRAAQH